MPLLEVQQEVQGRKSVAETRIANCYFKYFVVLVMNSIIPRICNLWVLCKLEHTTKSANTHTYRQIDVY